MFHLFFIFSWLFPLLQLLNFPEQMQCRAHISRSFLWCDLISSVWRIKAGAFGVTSISWKSSIASTNLFMLSFESHKIVWIIFLWIISLRLGPKPPVYMENQFISLIMLRCFFFWDIYLDFSFYLFLATHCVILSTQFKRWLCHTTPAAALTKCCASHTVLLDVKRNISRMKNTQNML